MNHAKLIYCILFTWKKKPKTIIRLPLIINTVVCVLAHTCYSCDSINFFYSDSTTFLNITDFSYLKKNS